MSSVQTLITEYLSQLAGPYYVRQCLVILCLFFFGGILTDAMCRSKQSWTARAVTAFPVGLCAFVITAYAMLVAGIPYKTLTVCAAVILETAAAVFINRKSYAAGNIKVFAKHMIMAAVSAAAVALISCSGLAPVAVSNDTMYYFKRYPDSIVYFGALRDQFDCWLTDTGLGVVSIDTLPPLFGFGETFGIREFFHIDFIVFFGMCIYERARKTLSGKGVIIATALITGVLVFATPFVLLGHWALANMYFMELFFIAAYTAVDDKESVWLSPVLLLALSLLRIEGTLFVVWLVLCISLFTGTGKKLAMHVMLPMTVLFGLYCLKIFTQYDLLDNIYLFLTPKKALLLVGVIAAAGIYLAFIEGRLPSVIKKYLPYIYLLGAVAGNILMLIRDSELYIGNLRTFHANLFRQSGWGIMPYFVIAMAVLLAVEYTILYFTNRISLDDSDRFNITLVAGFILLTLAASYGRGDALSGYVGDSGNRVLLQVVPLIVLMFGELALGLVGQYRSTE